MGITKYTCYLNRFLKETSHGGLSINGITRQHLRQHLPWNVEEREQIIIPVHRVDIKEHGT